MRAFKALVKSEQRGSLNPVMVVDIKEVLWKHQDGSKKKKLVALCIDPHGKILCHPLEILEVCDERVMPG